MLDSARFISEQATAIAGRTGVVSVDAADEIRLDNPGRVREDAEKKYIERSVIHRVDC